MTGSCCQKCKTGKKCASKVPETVYSWNPWGDPLKGRHHDNCYDYAFGLNNERSVVKTSPGTISGNTGGRNLTYTTCTGIARRVLSDYKGLAYKCKSGNSPCGRGYYKVMSFVAPENDFGNTTGDFHWYRQISVVKYKTRAGDTVSALAKFFRVTPTVIRAAAQKGRPATSNADGRITNMPNKNLTVLNRLNQLSKGRSQQLVPGRVLTFPVKLWAHKQGWATGPLLVDASGKTIRDPRRANRNYRPGYHYKKFCSAYCVKTGAGKVALARLRAAEKRRGFASFRM